MKRLTSILLISAIAITSCVENVDDVNLPQSEPKILVTCFITPNVPICASISKVQPIKYNVETPLIDTSSLTVTNALVSITNKATNESVILTYYDDIHCYVDSSLNFIKSNTEYQIEVLVDGFEPNYAISTVPDNNIATLDPQLSQVSSNGNTSYLCGLIINDYPNINNYYSIQPITFTGGASYSDVTLNNNREKITYITDNGKDGQNIPYSINLIYTSVDSVLLSVLSTDENYYKYHITIQANEESLLSEPSPIFSNFNNGIGIFASYTLKEVMAVP